MVICGSKIDLAKESTFHTDSFGEYKQVEMTLTTSSKQHFGLTNILSCCQKAVLSPVQALLDSNTNTLKPEFEKACLRIFRLCDHD